jgi:hypothetical protein
MQSQGINLLPQEISQNREKKKQTIDQAMLLSSVLPLLSIIVGVIAMIVGFYVERQVISGIERKIKQVETEILQYNDDKYKKALLVAKTRMLKDVIKRDVNPETFFTVVRQTIEDSGLNVEIRTYGIKSGGKFYIEAEVDELKQATDIARIFRNATLIEELEFNELRIGAQSVDGKYWFEISFNIIIEDQADGGR